jgi:hypothetical protein
MQIAITRKGREVTMDMGYVSGLIKPKHQYWVWEFPTVNAAIAFAIQLTRKWVKVRVNYGKSAQ